MMPIDRFSQKSRIIRCSHVDYPHFHLDLNELWNGAPDELIGKGSKAWIGGYKGRPLLSDQLLATIHALCYSKSTTYLRGVLQNIRALYRFLDQIEIYHNKLGQPLKIKQLLDITSVMGLLWIEPPPEATWSRIKYHELNGIKLIIEQARLDQGITLPWFWPTIELSPVRRAQTPTELEARELTHVLKGKVRTIFRRWEESDRLAKSGRDMKQVRDETPGNQPLTCSTADCHATYRAVVASTNNPVPTVADIRTYLGLAVKDGLPRWMRVSLTDLARGLYPSQEDTFAIYNLFIARTGWNPSTAAALDISNPDWAQPMGDSASNLWWIQSFKERSATWQDTVSSGKGETHPFQLIKTLSERTESLRAFVRERPELALLPTIARQSPWLSFSQTDSSKPICVIDKGLKASSWLKAIITSHNETAPEHRPRIISNFVPSDWRDVFASFTFRDSRYSWAIVQWALNHGSSATTRRYLRSLAWRNHSSASLSQFGFILVDEISVHQRVDPVVLRAKLEGHEITEAMYNKLTDHRRRSSVGMGCTDETMPDADVDPSNPRDGTEPCKQSDLCAACSQGVALWDSMPLLARKQVALEVLQGKISLLAWEESHWPAHLRRIRATLKQWPLDEVNRALADWRDHFMHLALSAASLKVV